MTKLSVAAAFVVIVLASAPAAAHRQGLRDPFQPLITPGEQTVQDTTATTTDGSGDTPPVTIDETDDGLPSTGFDIALWLAIAYVLTAAGGALIWFARAGRYRPATGSPGRGAATP